MTAHPAHLDSAHRSERDIIAFVEGDLKLPSSVTRETLGGLRASRSMLLEDVISLLTGLPRNRDEETCGTYGPRDPRHSHRVAENALQRWHAAVWLFKLAAVAPKSVATGTPDHERFEDIAPREFKVPSCLGSKENSIAIDMARANDAFFDKWWRKPSTRWYEVEFETQWIFETLRPLVPGASETSEPPVRAVRGPTVTLKIKNWLRKKYPDGLPQSLARKDLLQEMVADGIHASGTSLQRVIGRKLSTK